MWTLALIFICRQMCPLTLALCSKDILQNIETENKHTKILSQDKKKCLI